MTLSIYNVRLGRQNQFKAVSSIILNLILFNLTAPRVGRAIWELEWLKNSAAVKNDDAEYRKGVEFIRVWVMKPGTDLKKLENMLRCDYLAV